MSWVLKFLFSCSKKTAMAFPDKPEIRVSCAIIEKNGLVLAARRGPGMANPLLWEFPGGKIESRETPEDCLRREIREELGIGIAILGDLKPVSHAYPDFVIRLYPFVCKITGGEILPREHAEISWVAPEHLKTLDFTPADLPVIAAYRRWRGFTRAAQARNSSPSLS